MFKKIFVICLCVGMLMSGTGVWAAPEIITASVNYDSQTDSFIVSGTTNAKKANDLLALEVSLGGNIVAASQTRTVFKEDKITFEFSAFQLPYDVLSGQMTATVSGMHLEEAYTVTYPYNGADSLLSPLETVSAQIDLLKAVGGLNSTNISGLISLLKTNAALFEIDASSLDSLDAESKQLLGNHMSGLTLDLPAGYTQSAEKIKIAQAMQNLRSYYAEANAIAMFSAATNKTQMKNWLDTNTVKYGFGTEDSQTEYSEADIWERYLKAYDNDKFLELLCTKNGLETIKDIKKAVDESILLTEIGQSLTAAVQKLIEDYKILFPIDWTELNELSSEEQGELFSQIAGNYYESYLKAAEAVNDLLPDSSGSSGSGGGGGGRGNGGGGGRGNGGGGAGGFAIDSAAADAVIEPNKNTPIAFSDMDQAEWAKEAVAFLSSKGIVSGRGNGMFEPNAPITRAEFVKLLVVALKIPVSADKTEVFADVSANSWYYPYICAAQQEGLLLGDDAGNMRPEELIKREDMAVLLYRSYGVNEPQAYPELTFADTEAISDYAREAVAYFSTNGLINGVGDNLFAPKRQATRAEVAKLLYQMLEPLE